MGSDLGVDPLDRLVDTLLYEGYALYPYTPGAAKNSTPTPFGIVYPPAYAAGSPHTHAMLRVQCILCAGADATLSAGFRFLQAAGRGHRGSRAPDRPPLAAPRRAGRSAGRRGVLLRVGRRWAAAAGAGQAARRAAGRRGGAGLALRPQQIGSRAGRRRRRPADGAALEPALHPRGSAHVGRPLRLPARGQRPAGGGGGRLRERQHLALPRRGGRRRRCRGGDLPPRPPAAGPGEPRQPLRQHRDRGGPAAARKDAERLRARADREPGPGGAGDDRARRDRQPGADPRPPRPPAGGAAGDDPGRDGCGTGRAGGRPSRG